MVSSESSLSTQVFARADSLSAMHPTAWMAFLATITFTSVAYSLERGRKGGREGGREQVEKGRKGEGREERRRRREGRRRNLLDKHLFVQMHTECYG